MSAATSSGRSRSREARVAETLSGAMPPWRRFWPGAASGSNRPRWRRCANAMPIAEASPDPSGPVVISTPLVWWTSGWPGVCEPHVRSALRSSSSRP